MTKKSKYSNLREGDTLHGIKINRVYYSNRWNRLEFICNCGEKQTTTLSNFEKKVEKLCNTCIIKSLAKRKEKYVVNNRQLYLIWKAMNYRCRSLENGGHERYGGRGITVCWEWSDSNVEGFNNFYKDMGLCPSSKHSIDRIDNNKGYSPENCRWVTHKEQMNNKSCNHILIYKGVEYTLQLLADTFNIKANTLLTRLLRGWRVEEAVQGHREKRFKQPYSDKISSVEFLGLLKEYYEKGVDMVSIGKKYQVSPSNLSRVLRREDVLEFYAKNKSMGTVERLP